MSNGKRVLVATSNPGKIRDLIGAAAVHGIEIATLPGFSAIPGVIEDGATFEANAKKKAEHYSKYVEGELVIADDSGLEVDALQGAPGVRSARYAADEVHAPEDVPNSDDEANNTRLLRELAGVPEEFRTARFVCWIAVARNGHTLATFHGHAEGIILHEPRGENGFGYDPLFFFPQIHKTFAEIGAEEKARYSHRGAAFRQFLDWADHLRGQHPHSEV
jgi:XTP/dITP diphosphohydrolase